MKIIGLILGTVIGVIIGTIIGAIVANGIYTSTIGGSLAGLACLPVFTLTGGAAGCFVVALFIFRDGR